MAPAPCPGGRWQWPPATRDIRDPHEGSSRGPASRDGASGAIYTRHGFALAILLYLLCVQPKVPQAIRVLIHAQSFSVSKRW
eukprot:CAMPEP_0174351142 /NCGR_PEP_ID=MMETSP0811_2-20130205/8386_1 /TAXON_ID=73025 ORGANISM="Eutreptiella gymnastica-like, Strain CCMP1594" /NCGR_SAMPLE_ID=MMETSP0811_2 /ASSEMBLY_ACC=CAM_ASM_000667 /LENGTH=81 /DNA_ID=CAMNT_0015480059 /DNA_START=55 /DNA_END=300 /DNA_ORIENTATION=+